MYTQQNPSALHHFIFHHLSFIPLSLYHYIIISFSSFVHNHSLLTNDNFFSFITIKNVWKYHTCWSGWRVENKLIWCECVYPVYDILIEEWNELSVSQQSGLSHSRLSDSDTLTLVIETFRPFRHWEQEWVSPFSASQLSF